MNLNYFLLDLDGTLADTEPLHYKAYQFACRDFNIPFDWDFHTFCVHAHGDSLGVATQLGLNPDEWDKLYACKKHYYLQSLQTKELKYVPGADRFLSTLQEKNKISAIVTNSPIEQLDRLSYTLPLLKTVTFALTREDYSKAKPSPQGYLKAINIFMEKHEFTSNKNIAGFEDSPKGVVALERAFQDLKLENTQIHIINSELMESKSWDMIKF